MITGAEPLKGWKHCEGNVWMARVPNTLFGNYNPYTTVISGDWYFSPDPAHTGEVYLNGKAMYESFSLEDIKNPVMDYRSWDPEGTLYRWYTCQSGDFTTRYLRVGLTQTARMWRSTCAEIVFTLIRQE